MELQPEDLRRLARLARIAVSADDVSTLQTQLNGIFGLIDQLQAVDTQGVEPLAHPLDVVTPLSQQLREDEATEGNRRDANMANAPAAESGLFLARINELLKGQHGFYEEIFADLEIHYPPLRWADDYNPSLFGGEQAQVEKQANVLQLINAYRVRGHMLADIDPLNMTTHYTPELDLENFGLTIWDLDREFITGGLHGEQTATLRRILEILRKAYCGKVGIEYLEYDTEKLKPVPVHHESLEIMRRVFSGKQFSYKGELFESTMPAYDRKGDGLRTEIPIYVGAIAARAAAHGNGVGA